MDDLARFWAGLLSEDEASVRRAGAALAEPERAAVAAHLQRMADDEGYGEPQRQAARRALGIIRQAQ